ncbi:hypothetical protein [Nostoc sp. PA-18-2419]|uniref:hypothetical protein n=1 Tax=Nostoc sp. PA-18-2419 TaxID=2575443 RepID=UPI0016741A72|nr:hypothetical protein [Nostoc sp. PA-18-2419]
MKRIEWKLQISVNLAVATYNYKSPNLQSSLFSANKIGTTECSIRQNHNLTAFGQ